MFILPVVVVYKKMEPEFLLKVALVIRSSSLLSSMSTRLKTGPSIASIFHMSIRFSSDVMKVSESALTLIEWSLSSFDDLKVPKCFPTF